MRGWNRTAGQIPSAEPLLNANTRRAVCLPSMQRGVRHTPSSSGELPTARLGGFMLCPRKAEKIAAKMFFMACIPSNSRNDRRGVRRRTCGMPKVPRCGDWMDRSSSASVWERSRGFCPTKFLRRASPSGKKTVVTHIAEARAHVASYTTECGAVPPEHKRRPLMQEGKTNYGAPELVAHKKILEVIESTKTSAANFLVFLP